MLLTHLKQVLPALESERGTVSQGLSRLPEVLALIPARKDSRGVPGKNIREIAGRPLIAWSILAAQASNYRLRIVCSTDDDEIARVAENFGAEVPFRRPAALATDDASSLDVALHALDCLGPNFTHLLLLQPTSPLRTTQDIDAALQIALQTGADAILGVSNAPSHPYLIYQARDEGRLQPYVRPEGASLRRQDLPPAYVINGAMYINRVDSLRNNRTFFPPDARAYVMPAERSVDIDDWDHWYAAEQKLRALHG